MYFDESYDPNEENDTNSSITSAVKSRFRNTNNLSTLDKNFVTLKRIVKRPVVPGLSVSLLYDSSTTPPTYKTVTIKTINEDGTYDIQFGDNEKENVSRNVKSKYIFFPSSVTNGQKVKIEYYHTTNSPGFTVRNAVTGMYETGCKVGSSDEDAFFKVNVSSNGTNTRDPHILYFDNPEQYERHFVTKISQADKEKWNLKHHKYITKKM